jgi:hypothetical protein
MDAISKYHDSKIIHGRYISILFLFFKNIVCILTLECNLFFLFSCVRLRSTTKEVFFANAIRLVLEHRQLFTYHHAAKVVEATTKYHTNMGILLVHPLQRNNYKYSFSACMHHFVSNHYRLT